MSTTSHGRRRPAGKGRGLLIAMAVALTLCAGVVVAVGLSQRESAPPAGSAAPPPPPPPVPSEQDGQAGGGSAVPGEEVAGSGVEPLGSSPPVRIDIPKLKVSTSLIELGLDKKKAMETPKGPDQAGWYKLGPTPGAKGPSVIAAHVTWNRKPAVFFRLSELRRGDTVEVARQDGKTAVFTVDRIARYPKEKFPTIEVYGNVDHAALRLITCGGEFSTATNRYTDNVVVYASLTGTK